MPASREQVWRCAVGKDRCLEATTYPTRGLRKTRLDKRKGCEIPPPNRQVNGNRLCEIDHGAQHRAIVSYCYVDGVHRGDFRLDEGPCYPESS